MAAFPTFSMTEKMGSLDDSNKWNLNLKTD